MKSPVFSHTLKHLKLRQYLCKPQRNGNKKTEKSPLLSKWAYLMMNYNCKVKSPLPRKENLGGDTNISWRLSTHRLIKAEGSLAYACRSLYACSLLTVLILQSASPQRLSPGLCLHGLRSGPDVCPPILYTISPQEFLLCHFQKLLWNWYFSTPIIAKVLSERLANES